MAERPRPFVLDLESLPASPADAAPLPEVDHPLPETALVRAIRRRPAPSGAGRVFAWAGGAFLTLVLTIAAYDFIAGLMARWPLLGLLAMVLGGVAFVALLWMAGREWAGFMRLAKIDGLRDRVLVAQQDIKAARGVVADLDAIYAGRGEMAGPRKALADQSDGMLDADALLSLAEAQLMAIPDQAARREIEDAARKVAAATALVPLALVDVAVALAANLRMVRRIAEIYGGRSGTLGSWRVLKHVLSHLAATGLVAVGDDLISSVAGGGVLSKVSRRFGEGVVNAALTARVGIAAMEVCRPMPFATLPAPRVTNLLARATTGLFTDRTPAADPQP